MRVTGKCQNRRQLHEISIAFKGSFQSVHLFHLLRKVLKADTTGGGDESARCLTPQQLLF